MTTINKKDFLPEQTYAKLTPGKAVRAGREIAGLSQSELAAAAGLTQSAVSAIETGTATLGAERAERIARVLGVHPGVLLFPMWRPRVQKKLRRVA